jgi:hypothetical protein
MVVDIGWGAGAGEGPELEETVVHDVEGFGFVAIAVFTVRLGRLLSFRAAVLGDIGVGAGLVRAGIVNIGSLGVAWGGEAAVLSAGVGVTGAAFLAIFSGRARTMTGWQGAGWGLVRTFLV